MSKSTPSPPGMIRGPSSDPSGRLIRFGEFEVDLAAGELRKNGAKIKLQDQPFRVLTALLARPGEVVTREELRAELWPDDTYVDFDRSLNTAVNKLREALGDSANRPKLIETLPRRGYRFVGQVDGTPVSAIDPRAATAQTETSKEAALVRARQELKLALIPCTVLGLVLVAIFVAGFGLRTGSEPAQPLKFVLAPGEDVHDPVISPDGRHVAYVTFEGDGALWIQDLTKEQPRGIPDTEAHKGLLGRPTPARWVSDWAT